MIHVHNLKNKIESTNTFKSGGLYHNIYNKKVITSCLYSGGLLQNKIGSNNAKVYF